MEANDFKTWRGDRTQLEIALKLREAGLNVTPSAVASWEKDTPPRVKNAAVIGKVYGVTEKRVIEAIVRMSKSASVSK